MIEELFDLYVLWEGLEGNRLGTITLHSDASGHLAQRDGEKVLGWDTCGEGLTLLRERIASESGK